MSLLPVICCKCKRKIRDIESRREIKPGDVSHGYCDACFLDLEAEWFGLTPGEIESRRTRLQAADLRERLHEEKAHGDDV